MGVSISEAQPRRASLAICPRGQLAVAAVRGKGRFLKGKDSAEVETVLRFSVQIFFKKGTDKALAVT